MTDCSCNQGRLPCTCRTDNSDGTSPHSETRDAVGVVIDFTLVVVGLFVLIFVLASIAGFFWWK